MAAPLLLPSLEHSRGSGPGGRKGGIFKGLPSVSSAPGSHHGSRKWKGPLGCCPAGSPTAMDLGRLLVPSKGN